MSSPAPAQFLFGDFELNTVTRQLLRDGNPIAVTPKAFDLLCTLVGSAGRVLSREELLRLVWPDAVVEEANLSQQIFGLRRALGDSASFVTTIPGRGYQFAAEVTAVAPPQPTHAEPKPIVPLPLPEPAPRPFSPGILVPTIVGSAVLLLLLLGWLAYRRMHPPAPATFNGIVLADFVNTTGSANLGDTLREALEIELGQTPFVEVLSRGEVGSVLKQMGRDPQLELKPDLAREVCERSNKQVLLTSSVGRLGEKYIFTVQASQCVGGRLLAGVNRSVATQDGLLSAVNDIARDLRRQLGESSTSLHEFNIPIEQATTPSLEALKAYSLGVSLENRGTDPATMLQMYQRAVELDPNFAMGYEALANTYYANDEPAQAAAAARRAFDLSNTVTEREKFAIQLHFHADAEQDIPAAIASAKVWAATYPHDWLPLILMAGEYNDIGHYPEAIDAGRKSLTIEPNRALIYSVLARSERRAGHFAEVRRLGEEAALHSAESSGLHGTLYQTALAEHDQAALARENQWADQHGSWFSLAIRAEAASVRGELARARSILAEAQALATRDHLSETRDILLLDEAEMLYAFGEKDEARKLIPRIHVADAGDRADLAILQSRLGDDGPAHDFLATASTSPHATLLQDVTVPRVNAVLALEHGENDQAVAALKPTTPYDLSDYRSLSLHAEALAAAHRPDEGIHLWQRILDNPGVDPTSLETPLAHLSIARQAKAKGDTSLARTHYSALLAIWQNADRDLPIVEQVKQEAASLR